MKILVIDNGLYAPQADMLSDGGKHEVRYFTPWAKPFPTIEDYTKGYGYGSLKKELWFFKHIEESDMIVNFDVPNNDLIAYLRRTYKDKSVFGAGEGERLEHDRVFLKEWLKHLGCPVGPYEVIKGYSKLVEYLKKNPGKYVKTNIFREDMESFFFDNWDDDKYRLDEVAVTLSLFKEDYTFIVEDPIECVCQSGSDNFFTAGEFVPFSWGFEINKNLCVNKIIHDMDELPECLSMNIEKMRPLMERMDYRGPVSTEERITDPKTSYLIDFTARLPAPMGQMYPVFIKNWHEVVYKIGRNEVPEIDCDFDYIGSFALSSEHALSHNVKMIIDEKHLKDVRFQMVAHNKDGYFAVKGNSVVCVLIAGGNSPQEVLEKIKKAKDYVDGYSVDKDPVESIDRQFEEAHKAIKSLKIDF